MNISPNDSYLNTVIKCCVFGQTSSEVRCVYITISVIPDKMLKYQSKIIQISF